MKRQFTDAIIIVASIVLFAMEALQLHAQTPPAEFLPMGPYTNDFSAPMPNWWFYGIPSYYFDATSTDPSRDLSPYVYSNDYAIATEGLTHRFAAHAVYWLDEFFWLLGGSGFYAPQPYWDYYGALDDFFTGLDDVADQAYAADTASSLWYRVSALGGDGEPPWQWGAPGATNAVNIGQLKNAFSFSLDDVDGDFILDEYEYREFGALDIVEDLFDDPGGNGLCLLAAIESGIDPLAPPPTFLVTNQTATVRLFPDFHAYSQTGGEVVYERTFPIHRAGNWQQYFLVRDTPVWDSFRLDILYGDATNAFHSIGAAFDSGCTNTAVRLPHVSPNQTNLTLRIVTVAPYEPFSGDSVSCPSLSLVCWAPKVEFPTAARAEVDGNRYFAAVPDGVSRLEIPFTVDWSNPPDGTNPAEDWNDGGEQDFPLVLSDSMTVEAVLADNTGLPLGGTLLPASAGVYPLAPFGPIPTAAGDSDEEGEKLLVVSPRLSWPGTGRGCAKWLDYDPVEGTYSNCTAYPLDNECLQAAWHDGDDRFCNHAPEPTLDLGSPELEDILGHFFSPVSVDPLTSRCTVTLCGSNIWEDVISHYCPDAMWPECGEEDSSCDCDCDCGGAGSDGDKVGSCEFRLALGFPHLDAVSGFLWFRSEDIPRATPSMLSLLVRAGASVTCESNNPGGAISHVRCLDPRGRDVTVTPINNGLRLTVSNAACTSLDHSWEITNPGGGLSAIRIRKISRLDNPLSDRTYESFWTDPSYTMPTAQAQAWRITDNLVGLVETRIVSDRLNDPEPCYRALLTEDFKADAATGAVYAYSQRYSAVLGEGVNAVLRETYRAEGTFDAAHPRETFATYWEDAENQFLHGKSRLTYGDRPWTYRAYDALGRETLRLSQLDGSQCPVTELESLRPATLAAALAAIPSTTAFNATVTDYTPLAGDSGDDLDASLPRTVSEFEVRGGASLPAARTWTVYDRDGFDDDWGLPVLHVRTERAASPAAAFGDPGNAVSTETTFDIRDGLVRSWLLILDGMPVETTGEDGVTTRYSTDDSGFAFDLCGSPVALSHAVRQKETDLPLAGRAAEPMRPARIRVLDESRGTELFSGSALRIGNHDKFFDFRYNLYDDQDRLRATFFPDGSSTTNAYSCCRLLWSQDRDGRRTVRSAVTGQDRLYYANLEPTITNYPHFGSYGPYAADLTYWYRRVYNAYRITQHFMDAVGRETNTVTGAIFGESGHSPSSRTFTDANPYAWRSNATVAYPDGVSGHSVSTDARGLVTESFSRDFPDRTESVTFSYPSGEPSSPFSTNIVISYRNGARVSERRWDGGWTRTTDSSWRDALGYRTSLAVTEASDLPHPVTNSLSVADFLGRTILAETPLSSVTYVYDGATSRVVSETDSKSGITTLHHYDAYGEPTGTTRLGVTSLSETVYAVEGGEIWRVTTSIVSNGVKTASSTETRERLTGLSNALRAETVSIANGVTNSVSRSVFSDDVLSVTTVSPTRGTNVTESVCGVVGVVHDASGYRLYSYDPYGRLFHTLRVVPGTTTQRSVLLTMRDDAGNVIREDVVIKRQGYRHVFSTCHGYDCRGNRVATTNALGGVERRAYDALGRPVAVWGSAARPTLYAYDTQGRRTSLSTSRDPASDSALASATNFQFSIFNSQFDTTRWEYDPATGLCLRKVYPDGTTVTNTYTPDGLLATRLNASQCPEEREYDANRRLVSVQCADLSTWEYDDFGNCIRSEYDIFASDLLRDDHGAVTNELHESPATAVATGRDAHGRVVSRSAEGRTVHYVYAPDGQLATVSNDAFRVDYLYTSDRLDAGYVVTTAGGVEIARYVNRDTYRRHLVTDISTEVDGDEVRAFTYAYDALGRPVSRSGDAFAYNARSEVTNTVFNSQFSILNSYSYDPAGNFSSSVLDGAASAYAANGLNQYEAVVQGAATNALAYDAWGCLVQRQPYSFHYYDNLLGGVYTNRVNGPRILATYEYDAEKRRRRKVMSSQGTRHFAYSGWTLMVERWRQGNSGPYAFIHYVWGKDLSGTLDGAGGVGGLLATEVGGVWYFPLYDSNGNVTDYVSETGEVVASYAYDAFGRTITQSGTMADAFPFRFSTKYYDAESGLYYYGYRYYSPELGRWLTRDPIEEDGGDNLYAFCENNGVDGIDPYGCDNATVVVEGVGAGWAGSMITLNGKTAVQLNGELYYLTMSPQAGMYIPSRGSTTELFLYKAGNPRKALRIDYHEIPIGSPNPPVWHTNVDGGSGIAKVANSSSLNHQTSAKICGTGHVITVFKYAGRICFIAGVGMSLVDIYRADNHVRETCRQVGGWTGGIIGGKIGASVGAKAGMATAITLGQAGPQVGTPEELVTVPVFGIIGGISGGLIGGISGAIIGTKTFETVYDWTFTLLEKEEWEVGCEK